MLFKTLFQKSIKPKSAISFSKDELIKAVEINRNALDKIDDWVDETAFNNSVFTYGVPDFIKADLNKQINNEPTYSDYMLAIANKYFGYVNYLEIGVSVGKNFWQMLNGINNAKFTGFDVEEINPVLHKRLALEEITEWATFEGSIKKNKSSLSKYKFNSRDINYISADVWDENSWSKLRGNKYNIIFSDALHTPEAILFEFKMLDKFKLLNDRFVIVWDDLVGEMKDSFFQIIRKYDKAYRIKEIYLVEVNGWVGENEAPHSVGIISSFSF